MYDLHDFLEPVNIHGLNEDSGYNDGQFARYINVYETELPDISDADISTGGGKRISAVVVCLAIAAVVLQILSVNNCFSYITGTVK
jgi:hypothetical protein